MPTLSKSSDDKMFENISLFLSTAAPSLFPGPEVTVLIVPADGAPPRIERLATIYVHNDGNVDQFLFYVPDMRAYWGTGDGWRHRDLSRFDVTNHAVPSLNGYYYSFKSFAVDDLPMSKYGPGIRGDACIVKMAPEGYNISDFNNEPYDEITMDVVRTGLWKKILERLSKV